MHRMIRACAVALVLSGCAMPQPADPTLAPILDAFIAESEATGPEEFFDIFSFESTRSVGNTLIIDIKLGASGQQDYDNDPAAFEKALANAFLPYPCDNEFAAPILTNGGAIRYDVSSSTGRSLFSFSTSTCTE